MGSVSTITTAGMRVGMKRMLGDERPRNLHVLKSHIARLRRPVNRCRSTEASQAQSPTSQCDVHQRSREGANVTVGQARPEEERCNREGEHDATSSERFDGIQY